MDQLLLPGFRFYPTEEELIGFYLHKKLLSHTPEFDRVIPSIDIYNFEPSQLPEFAGQICHGDTEQWFFFMRQQEREARGGRPTRTTANGYWKATGSPSYVYSKTKAIGVKKTMVFYMGKAPTGRKTKWKMNEYKAIKQDDTNNVVNTNLASSSSSSIIPKLRDELSLCRIYVTSGCARAFDRRPPGITTTLNNITSTQNDDNIIISTTIDDYSNHNNVQVIGRQESVSGPGGSSQAAIINRPSFGLLSEKSLGSTDDSPKSEGHDLGTLQDVEGTQGSDNNYDIEMTESLDDTFIDWDQLGCL